MISLSVLSSRYLTQYFIIMSYAVVPMCVAWVDSEAVFTKTVFFVTYERLRYARVFVFERPFQPRVI